MRKFILPLIFIFILAIVFYSNSSKDSKIGELQEKIVKLESELDNKNKELEKVTVDLRSLETKFETTKKLAEIMSAEAYKAGYRPGKK